MSAPGRILPMFSFIKKKSAETAAQAKETVASPDTPQAEEPKTEPVSLFARLKQSLSKTRSALSDSLSTLILGRKTIDEDLLEEEGEDRL